MSINVEKGSNIRFKHIHRCSNFFPGNGRGQFDRPASVICDKKNRAIVADKDNHRVQIFTVGGEFILVFGEKGARNGQFNYPWDVACNSRDQILVSDTRNHRIQLFSPQGDFVNRQEFIFRHAIS